MQAFSPRVKRYVPNLLSGVNPQFKAIDLKHLF